LQRGRGKWKKGPKKKNKKGKKEKGTRNPPFFSFFFWVAFFELLFAFAIHHTCTPQWFGG
jgi:hypothetical protein